MGALPALSVRLSRPELPRAILSVPAGTTDSSSAGYAGSGIGTDSVTVTSSRTFSAPSAAV